jgi:hypothetical protein
LKWIEAWLEWNAVSWWFKRIEIPGVTAASHLHKDGIRLGGFGVINHIQDIGVVIDISIECINPECAVLASHLCVD